VSLIIHLVYKDTVILFFSFYLAVPGITQSGNKFLSAVVRTTDYGNI